MGTCGAEKRHLLLRARRLYTNGYEQAEVGRITGMRVDTLNRWRRRDRAAGVDWKALRAEAEQRVADARRRVTGLEQCFLKLIQDEALPASGHADALCKLGVVLRAEREHLAKLEAERAGA